MNPAAMSQDPNACDLARMGLGRMRPTTPPPPRSLTSAELSQRATELRTIAAQLLARAQELDEIAGKL